MDEWRDDAGKEEDWVRRERDKRSTWLGFDISTVCTRPESLPRVAVYVGIRTPEVRMSVRTVRVVGTDIL
jgi:hypothetical protein